MKLWTYYMQTLKMHTPSPLSPHSDHNLVHGPLYSHGERSTTWDLRSVEASASFMYCSQCQDCFEITDWEALCNPHGDDIDSVTYSIMEYINFFVENTVPSRRVQCFPNNKPWVTPGSGDKEELQRVQELIHNIGHRKNCFRRKLEEWLAQNNTKNLWRGLKKISGHGWDGDR